MRKKIAIALVLVAILVTNFSIWSYVNNPLQLQPWTKKTMGITFDPMRKQDTQTNGSYPSLADIDSDLKLLSQSFFAVRTYSVAKGMDQVPQLAEKYHLNVTLGAWIGQDALKNQQELELLVKAVNEHDDNIVRVLVGNEVMLRRDISEQALIDDIRYVKQRVNRQVSTSDTWQNWVLHPKVAAEVDFIAVHLLPYWEGLAADDAVEYVFKQYYLLKKTYPDKNIVITEVGWPSDGQPFRNAIPSRANQAKFLREFINRADKEKVNYYIIEAFDQPWKKSLEGSVGAYWGLFDSDRHPKYPMNAALLIVPGWKHWAACASVLSLALIGLFFYNRRSLKLPALLFFGLIANLVASTIFWLVSIGAHQYQTKFTLAVWILLLMMQAMAALILLIEGLEIAEVIWHKKTTRSFQPLTPPDDFSFPKVSIHLPIHNEPPEMVRLTLEALARLDYPNLEVLVIDNNTKDPAVWQPVEADCLRLGSMFRFFHLDNWPGFKAGAINYALEQTAQDASIIALIDSDYIVSPNWLKSMVPYFDNERVGFVQSPQDYRDAKQSTFKNFCYWEYAGFFNIGMVQRNEYNAIIQHGTMTMIRKDALLKVGSWSQWCICEDSELGLRLYEAGYDSVYSNQSFGQGLMPDTLSGYMSQRFRWVYGAMQIIKKHWRSFIPNKKSPLTPAQRYYFVAGWLPWFSDGLALIFGISSLLLSALVLYDPSHRELPTGAFLLPTMGLFTFKIIRSLWLYRARVPCTLLQSLGAFLTGLSLTHTVAKGVILGLFTSGKPFMRTPKLEKHSPFLVGLLTIKQELVLLILFATAISAMSNVTAFDNTTGKLWIAILIVQAVPYLATLLTLLVSLMQKNRHG